MKLYHYTESGLDNVYLAGGYTIHKSSNITGVSIKNTEGLHRAIGKSIISQPAPINGAELRFLRLEMELSQRELSAMLATSEQTFSLWERNRKKAIPGAEDRLLRVLYREYIGGDGSVRRLVDELASMNQISREDLYMRATPRGWKPELEKPKTNYN